MSTPKTPEDRQKEITDKIRDAQTLLSQALHLAAPLGGWAKQWKDIDQSYEAVKALWGRINNAQPPQPQ